MSTPEIKRIRVESITLERAEGLTDECGKPVTVKTFAEASAVLRQWSETAPREGGYDKCDFTILYRDGNTYDGRYDLKHYTCADEPLSLSVHIQGVQGFYAGTSRPDHLTQAAYQDYLNMVVKRDPDALKTAQHYLDTYQMEDMEPEDEDVTIKAEVIESLLDGFLDSLTAQVTAFPNFQAMLEAPGKYRPTLRPDMGQAYAILADSYDRHQEQRGDERRAYRG